MSCYSWLPPATDSSIDGRDNEMRIAVTERFFDDFLGLAPGLARKCRELIRQLQRTEAASITTQAIPGWRLHKLRNSPFRSLSVDMNYRMLVKLEGDVLFIHRVVKHDLADSEHVNRNDAATPLFTIGDSKLQWEELADALQALGLPEDHFKPLRSVHTEDDFVDVLQTLPKPWADTALSLFELSSVRISRAKYRLLQDDAELLRVLQGETSTWELYLHPSQQHIVNLPWWHRAAITGSAGTGKTVCAWYRTQAVAALGKKVGFVAPNKNVLALSKSRLATLLENCATPVYYLVPSSAHELAELAKTVDHIIVDEAQEISPQWFRTLTPITETKPLGITIFYDINQLRGSIPPNDRRLYKERCDRWNSTLTGALKCIQLTLSVNYRNSREIALHYLGLLETALLEPLHCEVPIFEAGAVVQVEVKNHSDLESVVCDIVRKMLKEFGEEEIAIICVVARESETILDALRKVGIPCYSAIGKGSGVFVSTPEIARGHEKKAIIVVGPKDSLSGKNYGNAIRSYIALSRARDRLVVIATS